MASHQVDSRQPSCLTYGMVGAHIHHHALGQHSNQSPPLHPSPCSLITALLYHYTTAAVVAASIPTRIPTSDLLGVTALLLTCSYRGKEFVRVGYYVNIEYTDPELLDPTKPLPDPPVISKLQRNVMAGEARGGGSVWVGVWVSGCVCGVGGCVACVCGIVQSCP